MAMTQAERSAKYRIGLKRVADEIKAAPLAQADWTASMEASLQHVIERIEALEAK